MRLRVRRASTVAALACLVAAAAAYAGVPGVRRAVDAGVQALSATSVQDGIGSLREYLLGFGPWAPAVSAALMVLQSVIAPLPAFLVTFTNGLLFGWAWGALLSWSSAMLGAALCFGIARSLGRPAVERILGGSAALDAADRWFVRHGRSAILLARLVPIVPFDPVSYAAGLTASGFWPFFVATGVGQLPATIVYSWLGERATGSATVLLWVFALAAALALAAWAGRQRLLVRRRAAEGAGRWWAP